MEIIYEELFSKSSNSSTVDDCAKIAATAWRSRQREISLSAAITRVVEVIVRARGAVTVVV